MENESRTIKSFKNAYFNLFNQIFAVVIQFLIRTVFIKTLSDEYLGVNGLFSNILSVLSLAELGLGTALITNMYGPIARDEKKEIVKYFKAYKKVYSYIGIIIGVGGIILPPFLNYLLADAENIPQLKLLFLLYLSDTVATYFFAQYRALFSADQKDFINANNRTILLIIQSIVQVLVLFAFHSFILYMLIKIICNLLSGYVLSLKAKKQYPYILYSQETDSLDEDEKNQLIKDSIGVLSTRIELTVLNSTDTIILSSVLGSVISGRYSNYSLIVCTVRTMIGMIFSSMQASIGNYCAQKEVIESKELYFKINYVYYCLYGAATICLIGLLTPTLITWLGHKFELELIISVIISLNFYFSNSRQSNLQFITIYHLLPKINVKNICEAVINLGVSLVLVNKIGLIGIFIGTAVSLIITSVWFEPYILYKYKWKNGLVVYYLNYLLRFLIVLVGSYITVKINTLIYNENIMSLIMCFIISIIISVVFVTLPFIYTKEFKFAFNSLKNVIMRVLRRRKSG